MKNDNPKCFLLFIAYKYIPNMKTYEVIIIGGGLAGLVSALHLSKHGVAVALFEKKQYPFHKVCGEYISNEVLPYLNTLGVDLLALGAKSLTRFQLSAPNGQYVTAQLPLGGTSISRYTIDDYLSQKGQEQGVDFYTKTTVQTVDFKTNAFTVTTKKGMTFKAKVVIGSFGKRSNIDAQLQRSFFKKRTYYIGVKQYFKYDFPEDLVALHNFKGGYCGVSMVENGLLNVAYLTTKQNLTQNNNSIEAMENTILKQNPQLADLFENGERILPKSLAISNISFQQKELIHHHILMTGDAAGMIPPLSGNGMAMAIHAAKIASEETLDFLAQQISRTTLETNYQNRWKALFKHRLFFGRKLQYFMGQPLISNLAIQSLQLFPQLLPVVIKQTHGESIC